MKNRALLLCFLIALPTAAHCADKDAEALLASMRKAYAGVKSARFTVSTQAARQKGAILDVTTQVSYLAPTMMTAQTTSGPLKRTVTSDGKRISIDNPQMPVTRPFTLQILETAMPVNLETLNFWDYKRQLSTDNGANMHTSKLKVVKQVSWNSKTWIVLEETAPQQGIFVRYFIDPKTYLVHHVRSEQIDSHQMVMDTKITKLELNPKLNPAIFQIKAKKVF